MSSLNLVREASEYPAGLVFDVRLDEFSVRLTTLPDNELRFVIGDGPYARTETVRIVANAVRPGLFIVSWVEKSGATVVHVEDFDKGYLHSHATLPDGTFLRMQGPIEVINQET